jgi:hypothetical protein
MTTPSRYGHLGSERPNDGVLGSGTARAMKGGRVGARGRASRVERTASLFAVDRLATGKEGWLVVREAWWSRAGPGERCDPLARGWVAVKRWRLARWCPELGPPGLPPPTSRRAHNIRWVRQLRSVLFNCCDVDSNSHHRAGASASHRSQVSLGRSLAGTRWGSGAVVSEGVSFALANRSADRPATITAGPGNAGALFETSHRA